MPFIGLVNCWGTVFTPIPIAGTVPVQRLSQASVAKQTGLSHRFDSRVWQHSFMEIGHEVMSRAILSLPLIKVGQFSVNGKSMCT